MNSPAEYKIRSYRHWVESKGLVNFTVKIDTSDLFIRACSNLQNEALEYLKKQRLLIENYIEKHPEFAVTLKPYTARDSAPEIIQEMVAASRASGVGPMAAVAGAIAEYVGKHLVQYSPEVIVENGGDIFIQSLHRRAVGIFAGMSPYTGKLAIEIPPSEHPCGICTSSGTVGPSLSFGKADAVTVICASAIWADAWATRMGNMVKSPNDMETALRFVQDKPEIKGIVVIIGDKIGVWGEVKLVNLR
ncbi:MAG: UPF0280 family protein [Candidatus Omnitrophota bacterium]